MSFLKLGRIPGRYHATLTGTTMTVALTGVVSFALTIKNLGIAPDALARFLRPGRLPQPSRYRRASRCCPS